MPKTQAPRLLHPWRLLRESEEGLPARRLPLLLLPLPLPWQTQPAAVLVAAVVAKVVVAIEEKGVRGERLQRRQ